MTPRAPSTASTRPPTAYELASIALGSNLGDREAHLRAAVEALCRLPETRFWDASRVYETQAVGGPPGQQPYLNAVVRLHTKRSAPALLVALLDIERAHGRTRTPGVRFEPRTLDLDLLLYGEAQIATPDLTVPHPRLAKRRFVLAPLCEVAAEVLHPGCGRSFGALLEGLPPDEAVAATDLQLRPKNTP